MKTKLIACVILVLPVAGAAASLAPASAQYSTEGAAPVESPFSRPALGQADIRLPNGAVLKNASVRSISGDRATVLHAGGLTSVAVADLPEELRPRQAKPPQPKPDIMKAARSLAVTRSTKVTGGSALLSLSFNLDDEPQFGFVSDRYRTPTYLHFLGSELKQVTQAADVYFQWSAQAIEKKASAVSMPLAVLRNGEMEFKFNEERGGRIIYDGRVLFLEDVDALRELLKEAPAMIDEMSDKVGRLRAAAEIK